MLQFTDQEKWPTLQLGMSEPSHKRVKYVSYSTTASFLRPLNSQAAIPLSLWCMASESHTAEAHVCEQLVQSRYMKVEQQSVKLWTLDRKSITAIALTVTLPIQYNIRLLKGWQNAARVQKWEDKTMNIIDNWVKWHLFLTNEVIKKQYTQDLGLLDILVRWTDNCVFFFLQLLCHSVNALQLTSQLQISFVKASDRTRLTSWQAVKLLLKLGILLLEIINLQIHVETHTMKYTRSLTRCSAYIHLICAKRSICLLVEISY